MAGDECFERLLEELCRKVGLEAPGRTWGVMQGWVEDVRVRCGEASVPAAYNLLYLLKMQPYSTTEINVDASQKADRGGTIIGSTAGLNNKSQTGDITVYNTSVDQSLESLHDKGSIAYDSCTKLVRPLRTRVP